MKTVLFITTSDLSGTSGHNIATREMVAAFGRHPEMAVVVVCPEPNAALPPEITKTASNIYPVKRQETGSIVEHVLTQGTLLPAMLSAFRTESPDAVVTRHSPTMVVPVLATKATRRPYYLLARGLSHERLRFSRILRRIFWLNVRLADQVYPAYNDVKSRVDRIRTDAQPDSQLFTNAVDPEKMSPVDRIAARQQLDLDIDPDDFVIGFVGSFKQRHALQELVKALDYLPADTKILLVGTGPMETEIRRLVSEHSLDDRVMFTGFVDHSDVNTYISATDVAYGAFYPNAAGNPIKCYEYLACERPIITDDRREFQFVCEHDLGILVESVTPEGVARAISSLRNRTETDRRRMGEKGRNYVLENHTWDRLAEIVYNGID